MKLSSEFATDLLDLSDAAFHAVADLTSTSYMSKTITLNVGTKVGDVQAEPSDIANRIISVVHNFREDIRPCGGVLFMDEVEYHYHTNGDEPTMINGVPIEETTIEISFNGNLSLPTIKALGIALCYATNQEAIPVLIEARYRAEGAEVYNSTATFGLMIGQTLSDSQKWGKFNPEFFIK